MSWRFLRNTGLVRTMMSLAIALVSVATLVGAGSGVAASAATGANFVATSHDLDLHCSGGDTNACAYLKLLTDTVRNGSTLPILALDQRTMLTAALAATGEAPVITVDPSNAALFDATAFVDGTGKPRFSAIITASDQTCGGAGVSGTPGSCDNTPAGESNVNARKDDFTAFFNAGGGILALSGAGNRATYYDFVPLGGPNTEAVRQPFTVTQEGAALGITDPMVNCCDTHNSFLIFTASPDPVIVLEDDSMNQAETVAALGATIPLGDFSEGPVRAIETADADATIKGGQDGYTVTFLNTGTVAVVLDSVTDVLPPGFSYVAGSTTGGITVDPGTAGSRLTWTGPFTVPANGGTFTFHFKVTASSFPGTYLNTVTAAAGTTAVMPAAGAARIDVAVLVGAAPMFPVAGLPVAAALVGGTLALYRRRRRRQLTRPAVGILRER